MEIVIVWSWLSFIVGAVSAVLVGFILALVFSFKQWRKQKQESEKAFSVWTNSGL
jgi:hypothetical protein